MHSRPECCFQSSAFWDRAGRGGGLCLAASKPLEAGPPAPLGIQEGVLKEVRARARDACLCNLVRLRQRQTCVSRPIIVLTGGDFR